MKKIIVGISVGDPNSINVEVILKVFRDNRIFEFCTPVLFANNDLIDYHKKFYNINVQTKEISNCKDAKENHLNLLKCFDERFTVDFGNPTDLSGKYAYHSLKKSATCLQVNQINVLVTAPIDKKNIYSKTFPFVGHTEYLETLFKTKGLMLMVSDDLKIGLVTSHIPIKNITQEITPDLIFEKTEKLYQSLQLDFNITKPKIAVLSINPHSGDNGVIGDEDQKILRPVIDNLFDSGKYIFGPYSSDSFFGNGTFEQFDGVLAIYHDQGLIPFKTLSFGDGVNFTAGLNVVRTSPDHGTAFDIAGKNKANPNSFRQAVFKAIEIFNNRKQA